VRNYAGGFIVLREEALAIDTHTPSRCCTSSAGHGRTVEAVLEADQQGLVLLGQLIIVPRARDAAVTLRA
jgi:hypothetical protein